MKRIVTLVPLVLLLLAACGGGGETTDTGAPATGTETGLPSDCEDVSGGDAVVVAVDNEFQPICLGLAAGQDVTVRNEGNSPHTFTIPDSDIDVVLDPGAEEVVEGVGDAVPEGQEVEFVCQFHPGMVGYLNRV